MLIAPFFGSYFEVVNVDGDGTATDGTAGVSVLISGESSGAELGRGESRLRTDRKCVGRVVVVAVVAGEALEGAGVVSDSDAGGGSSGATGAAGGDTPAYSRLKMVHLR